MAKQNLSSKFELITPEMALDWLTSNTKNYRKPSRSVVLRYAEAMKNGRWQTNGEAIVFNEDGILLDGQHRLYAIIEAEVSVTMLVVRGVKRDVSVFDDGRNRTIKDFCNARGLNIDARTLSVAVFMMANSPSEWNCRGRKDLITDYADAHADELRQLRGICGNGVNGSTMEKKWIMATVYMLLRSGENISTLCDFFHCANTGLPMVSRECSAALVFGRCYRGKYGKNRASNNVVAGDISILLQAYQGFKNGDSRKRNYSESPEMAISLWHRIRKIDGLE